MTCLCFSLPLNPLRLFRLPTLQIRQPSRLIMDIPHLLITLQIEIPHLLPRRCAQGLLKVRTKSAQATCSLIGDAVATIDVLGLISGVELGVEVVQRVPETRGEAVLLVEGDGLLDRMVADHVAVREVFGDYARAGLVFLFYVVDARGVVFGFRGFRVGFGAG